jgi:alkanesulfonate monooxygenase SsuD/methylene tetrahydromethanopterin reductase-like flavin-dependent oxidoreductase (luciferase family)
MTTFGYLLPTRNAAVSPPDSGATTASPGMAELAVEAERLGFDAAWVGDSVLARPRHEPLTTLAAVGGATDLALGTAVYLPALRHPVHVAHQTATVARMSDGGFYLGVGASSGDVARREHGQLGVTFDRRGAVLDEALQVVTSLWSGGPVSFDGEFFELDGARIEPTPDAPIPLAVGGNVDPDKGFTRPVRNRLSVHGDAWLPIRISPETYEAGRERASDLLSRGSTENSSESGAGPTWLYYLDVVVADSEERALERAAAFYESYYPGWQPTDEALDGLAVSGAFGPPDHVQRCLDRYRDAGVESFVVRVATDNQREQLRRFAQVIG